MKHILNFLNKDYFKTLKFHGFLKSWQTMTFFKTESCIEIVSTRVKMAMSHTLSCLFTWTATMGYANHYVSISTLRWLVKMPH